MANFRKDAFTLMELMTVVVIVGIIASFAIPNYQRTIERAHQRDAEANLMAINAANRVFFAENGFFAPGPLNNVNDINNALRLAIVPNGMLYSCPVIAANSYTCQAQRVGGAFTVTITQAAIGPGNPTCAGACP